MMGRFALPWSLPGITLVMVCFSSGFPRIGLAQEPAAPTKDLISQKEFFGLTKIHSVEITLTPGEYEAMQPPPPAFPGGPPPVSGNGNKNENKKRETERNLFGTEFPWVEGEVTMDGVTAKKVGLRYSGEITYLSSGMSLKRPLRIGFDKLGGEKVMGLSGLQLQAMSLDPAKSRQAIAANLFNNMGVPAPRTAFAEVTLTVPGQHDKASLGLYTIVEEFDPAFLSRHFGSADGLLMRPFGAQGINHMGDQWAPYQGALRPARQATKEEAKRVIEFAALINKASDEEFHKRIGEFVDVKAFLKFMAANALTCNLESFFALGHNYLLYLDPKTNKFQFLPGDLEFSLTNFLLMGSPDQLMDLSIRKPYPGTNKLPDRLLANKEIHEQYLALVKELTQQAFTKDQIIQDAQSIEKATKAIREKEAKAAAARTEQPGFGGPGFGPQAPDLKTFAEKRTGSIAMQLAAKSKGFVPQPLSFGPPPGGGPGGGGGLGGPGGGNQARAMDDRAFATEVKAPTEFEARLFAAPPRVSYPVAISCEPTGAIYVAVDEQGSLGRTPGGGRILRLVDKNGDGKAESATNFAKVEHPRGVVYRDGKVWVCHPPELSVFQDTDGDGIADKQEVLVTGLTTNQITDRGGDHTTNGVRLGIDGWLYIGVGDYGIKLAKGKDGKTLTLRGGGVIRVRPDGTELELYCSGLRNPFDLAIDPFMNVFARDNTNDGAGWDTRVSLLRQSALYGYTQLFANFTEETMPTLGTFGNGGGTAALMVGDPRWPERYQGMLLTGDWGRSEVYLHDLKPNGPTFDLKQEVFLTVPRATGMDLNADGQLFVASWRGGEASVFVGPNIGFITRVAPKGLSTQPFPDLKKADEGTLLGLLSSPNTVVRFHAQGEILARGPHFQSASSLEKIAADETVLPEARAAAVFTLKQLSGKETQTALLRLARVPAIREYVLRALTDRLKENNGLTPKPFIEALADASPRVRAQALISLGRLGDPSAAKEILPLTIRTDASKMPTQRLVQNQPDPGRVVPHLAVRALVALNAVDPCIEALDGPYAEGALWVLRSMHRANGVDGLIKKLRSVRDPELRRGILTALIRLYYREADYTGSWWGIRPDNTGPYYDRAKWELTDRIGSVVTAAILDADKDTAAFLKKQLTRHQVALAGVAVGGESLAKEKPIILPKVDPNNPDQISNMAYELASQKTLTIQGDSKRGETLFKSQSCIACHTTADGQAPKGPHLLDIGKRYKPEELVESILKPSAKLAQGYESYRFEMTDGRVLQGFVVGERADATVIRESDGVQKVLKKTDIESRTMQKLSAMPEGLSANLTPGELADLIAYLRSLQ